MNCLECFAPMNACGSYERGDPPPDILYRYLLYQCPNCGALCKDEHGTYAGETWIFASGQIQFTPREVLKARWHLP